MTNFIICINIITNGLNDYKNDKEANYKHNP